MEQTGAIKRILWAVDALQDCAGAEAHCVDAIRALIGSSRPEIEPVYVVPPKHFGAPFGVAFPVGANFEAEGLEILKRRLSLIDLPHLKPPKIIDVPVMSTLGSVRLLCKYAEETKADLIVAGSHCRSGVSRVFLGSFAETLVLHSPIPVLVVGREVAPAKKVDSILFPTDFGPASEQVFSRVTELAKATSARVIIHHAVMRPLVFSDPLTPVLDISEHLEKEKKQSLAKMEAYQERAKLLGVESRLLIKVSSATDYSESDAILTAARESSCSLIARFHRAGPPDFI